MKLEEIIKSKAKKLLIFYAISIVVATAILIAIMSQKSFYQAFLSPKEIHNFQELNNAKFNNAFVKLYFTDVYDTGYDHTLNGRIDGVYLDFDVDGYIVFAVVEKDIAKKILDKNQNYIEGELCEFKAENKEALDTIIKDYIDQYKEKGYTETDVKSAIYSRQIDGLNYSDSRSTPFFVLFIFGAIDLIFVILGIKALKIMLNPSKKIIEENAKEEYEMGDFTSIVKGIYYTKNYIFYETAFKIECKKIEDMAWVYNRVVKQNFVTTYRGVVICFADGSTFQIAFQSEEIFVKLSALNSNVLMGYTPENIKKYREIVKEYKERNKEVIK